MRAARAKWGASVAGTSAALALFATGAAGTPPASGSAGLGDAHRLQADRGRPVTASLVQFAEPDARPFRLYLPALSLVQPGGVLLEIVTPDGPRPLHGALVPDVAADVRLTVVGPDSRLARVTWATLGDSLDDSGLAPPIPVDLTGRFGELSTGQSATARVDLAAGAQTVEAVVDFPGGRRVTTAGLGAFDNQADGFHTPVYGPVVRDEGLGLAYETDAVLLSFEIGTSAADVSDTLSRFGLAPLDWTPGLGLLRARVPRGESPVALGRSVAGRLAPPLIAVLPNLALTADTTVGEDMPTRLTDTYLPAGGDGCRGNGARRGCFEGGREPQRELRQFRYHFYYDTFAAHRLVTHLLRDVTTPAAVGIAVVDTGFGKGANPTNIPNGAFFNFSQSPFHSDQPVRDRVHPAGAFRRINPANGVQECRAQATDPWAACGFDFRDVRDTGSYDPYEDKTRDPHGTLVAVAAAGRPDSTGGGADRGVLAIGRHASVRVLRGFPSTWEQLQAFGNQLLAGVWAAALDPQVRVINTSFGARIPDVVRALAADPRPGDDTVRVNGAAGLGEQDTIVVGTGANQETARITRIAANTLTLANGLANNHDRGDPVVRPGGGTWLAVNLAGTFTNVVQTVTAQGKIWVASAGNDGHCTDPAPTPAEDGNPCSLPGRIGHGHWPSDFAPGPAPRGVGDPLVVAVGDSRTEAVNTGPEALAAKSNFGPRVSVVAGGTDLVLVDESGNVGLHSGTSFSSPTVAGLAAEMIYLDRNLRAPDGGFTPLQIVELIESTADDLGSTGRRPKAVKPNDKPADGFDVVFGHGRINAWKAMLAVANGGPDPWPQARAQEFPNLRPATVNNATWYGFVVVSPVYDATLWIDGAQVKDPVAVQPDGGGALTGALSAYKGVESGRVIQRGIDLDGDRVPDEDPTSDVVPVGVARGEYVATFSAQRQDLVAGCPASAAGQPCTLSLRRPGETAADAPFWSLRLELAAMMQGAVPGVVYDDYVFEITPTDFGDAAQPYPSRLVADNGARSLNANLEWFGPERDTGLAESDDWLLGVGPEPNAAIEVGGPDAGVDPDGTVNVLRRADLDRFDKGVVFFPRTYLPGGTGQVEYTVCVADARSRRYANSADTGLYVNGWIDWDTDGTWEEEAGGREHVVDGVRIHPGDWSDNSNVVTRLRANGNCATFRATFRVPEIRSGELWARFRLDYGENAGRNDPRPGDDRRDWSSHPSLRDPTVAPNRPQPTPDPRLPLSQRRGYSQGATRFGEVEDYLLGSDYGDAPDPYVAPGRYPTRHASRGAYSLSFNREWLGPDANYALASREVDGCDQTTAEEDRADGGGVLPNLAGDCKGADQDRHDDGAIVPASVAPGEEVTVVVTVTGQVDTRGFANRGSGGEDSKGVPTLQGDCTLKPIPDQPDTPAVHRGRGRYAAWRKEARLFLNAWADWNADGDWSAADEHVLRNLPVDPEDFGKDGRYTLGEPFEDTNLDGVYTAGVDGWRAADHDVAGVPSRAFRCPVKVPDGVARDKTFYWRFRLDYGEDAAPNDAVTRFGVLAAAEARNLAGYHGGSWWGEVEDYPSAAPRSPQIPDKSSRPGSVPPGTRIHYTVAVPAPAGLTAAIDAWIRDRLPAALEFVGDLSCTVGQCRYDPLARTVLWDGLLAPGTTVVVEYDAQVPTGLPACPPTVVNEAQVFDGERTTTVRATTRVECPAPTSVLDVRAAVTTTGASLRGVPVQLTVTGVAPAWLLTPFSRTFARDTEVRLEAWPNIAAEGVGALTFAYWQLGDGRRFDTNPLVGRLVSAVVDPTVFYRPVEPPVSPTAAASATATPTPTTRPPGPTATATPTARAPVPSATPTSTPKPVLTGVRSWFVDLGAGATSVALQVDDAKLDGLIYGLEFVYTDQQPPWTSAAPLVLPPGWAAEPLNGGLRLATGGAHGDNPLRLGAALQFVLRVDPPVSGPLILIHATDRPGANLGYVLSLRAAEPGVQFARR